MQSWTRGYLSRDGDKNFKRARYAKIDLHDETNSDDIDFGISRHCCKDVPIIDILEEAIGKTDSTQHSQHETKDLNVSTSMHNRES